MGVSFQGFDIPRNNWFKVPNSWIDVSAKMSLAERAVVMYIIRHTWGYLEFEKYQRISVDEFMHGRKRKGGGRIDRGTGLSHTSIRKGLKEALENGFIEVEEKKSRSGVIHKYYRLHLSNLSEGNSRHKKVEDHKSGGKESVGGSTVPPQESVGSYNKDSFFSCRDTSSKTSSSQKQANADSLAVNQGFFDNEEKQDWIKEQATILRQMLVDANSNLLVKKRNKLPIGTKSIGNSISALLERKIPKSQIEDVIAYIARDYQKNMFIPRYRAADNINSNWTGYRDAYTRYQNSLSKDHSAFDYDPDKDPNELVREWIDDNYDEYDIDDSSAVIEEHMIEAGCKALNIKRGKVTLM